MITKFVKRQKEANSIYTYYFEKPSNFKYIAGQYLELSLAHQNPDNRGLKRWYTLSSSPRQKYLSITTKHTKKGSSFKKALFNISKGQEIKISECMGDFVLPKNNHKHLLFLIGGIGITPVLSILKTLKLSNNHDYTVDIIYLLSDLSEAVDLGPYREFINKLTIIDSSKMDRLYTSKDLVKYLKDNKVFDYLLYLSGPEKMIDTLTNDLIASRIDKNRIISDYFEGYDQV